MAKRNDAPFEIGDEVVSPYNGEIRVVSWRSKHTTRRDQLIATEYNGYCNPCDSAASYRLASGE